MRAAGAMSARIGPAGEILQQRIGGNRATKHLVVPALVVERDFARQGELAGRGVADAKGNLVHRPTLAAVARDGILELQV